MTAVWCLRCGTYRHWAGSCPNETATERAARLARRVRRVRIAIAAATNGSSP